MDAGDYFYLALFAYWLYSQIKAVAAKNKARQEQIGAQQQVAAREKAPSRPPPQRAPRPSRRASPEQGSVGQGLLTSLDDLEREIDAALGEVDERVRAQVSFLVEQDYRPKAESLRRELRDETAADFSRVVQETQWLVSHYRGVLQTARVHSGLRQQPELRSANTIADALVKELDQPRNVAKALPPPVAIVWDTGESDRLRESALADSTLFLPRTVAQDASHWSLAAPELARYLSASAPSLYRDVYQGLDLGAAEASVGNDPKALTRVLYASWISRIVADAVGTLLFGPAYLLSIAKLYAQPAAPARVTSIILNQDGTVHTEPPAHVRVHVTARWLTRMGYASEATEIRRGWDEEHGSPEVLGFWGTMTSVPAALVLDEASALTDQLYQLPFDAFGTVRLAHVPGLAGWENHARQASAAKASLQAGERTTGSARALIAAAIEASLEAPEENRRILEALLESVRGARAAVPKRTAVKKTRRPAAAASANPFARLTGRDVAEALIVGDILLERPRAR